VSAPDSLYDLLATLQKDPALEHGAIFRYQTPKTDVVNWMTNRVTGKSFQDQMSDVLWTQLGTEAETYVLLDRCGTLVAGGGLNAAPRDLARFAMMMLNDGTAGGRQIVAPAVIATLETGGSREAFSAGPEAVGAMAGGDWSYRAQWWIRHTPGREAISAIGIHGQWIYIDRRRRVAIVKQSSQPVSSDPAADQFILNAFDAVIDHLGGPAAGA
jgi:CubicO group peptidase (beta-lactamase class C family)